MRTAPPERDVRLVSAAIFLTIAVGGGAVVAHHLAAMPGALPAYAVHVLGLAVAFLLPAQWIGRPGDVLRRWRIVLPAILAGTLLWDGLMAAVTPRHIFLDGWWFVYAISLITFAWLLALHGILVALVGGVRRARGRRIG